MDIDVGASLDSLRTVTLEGEEWSARELMPFSGYERWERFRDAISRAIQSVEVSGLDPTDHFRGAAKMVRVGSGVSRQVEDYRLTRYGCYILFQNADARKPEIAALQQYFAVQTRKQELTPPRAVPTNFAEALELAAMEVRRAEALEVKVAELTPSARAWDVLASAGIGDFSVDEAAKILSRDPVIQMGRDRLFTYMHAVGWLFRQGPRRRWHARQSQVDCGRLVERSGATFLNTNTGLMEMSSPTIRVTAKGLAELHKRLGGVDTSVLAEEKESIPLWRSA